MMCDVLRVFWGIYDLVGIIKEATVCGMLYRALKKDYKKSVTTSAMHPKTQK
jgi:hypothetical protein